MCVVNLLLRVLLGLGISSVTAHGNFWGFTRGSTECGDLKGD